MNPIPGILQSPRTNIDLIIGHSFSLFRATGGIIEWVAALAAVTAGLLMFFKAIKRTNLARLLMGLDKVRTEISGPHKKLYLVLALWIAPYLIFLCFFEPQDPYLRLLYAPALALALGLVVSNCLSIDRAQNKEALSFNGSSRVAVLAVATLAFFNLAFFIAPHLRTESNKTVARARDARKVWDEQTVIYFLNRNEVDTTFEYFNDQTKWRRLSRATLGMLENEVEYVHKRGGSVWINKGLAEALNAEWLARYARGGEIRLDVDYAPGRYLQLLPPE